MEISLNDWRKFKNRLAALSQSASDEMLKFIQKNGGYANIPRKQLIDYAYGLATKYGEASASLAAEMYDTVATLSKAGVPAAEVAETAEYGEVAKAINGVTKKLTTDKAVSAVPARLAKRAGADTTLKNAERDGAQFAWIPVGDTCAFCLTLASRGWQYMSKDALKNGHAEHIHANCDCTYAVRFDDKTVVKGYDPEEYRRMYDDAEGSTPEEKINSMRRIQYEKDKDKINEQKREAYSKRKNSLQISTKQSSIKVAEDSRNMPGDNESTVISAVIETSEYEDKMKSLQENNKTTAIMINQARTTLYHRNGTLMEDLVYINPITNDSRAQRNYNKDGECIPTEKMKRMVKDNHKTIIAMHNHPKNMLPSYKDLYSAKKYKYGLILCHNGDIIKYTVSETANLKLADVILNNMQRDYSDIELRNSHISNLKDTGVILEVL